ncbi:MAG: hypothetical protein HY873_11235, partial [Chloroflexi bacterium]|nr:hypothetical protein [Chloroflexota bacterium]
MRTDLFCDGVPDIFAGGPNVNDTTGISGLEAPGAAWPDTAVWKSPSLKRKGAAPVGADAYVSDLKPMPTTTAGTSYERADIYTAWLGGSVPLYLPAMRGFGDIALPYHEVDEDWTVGANTLRVVTGIFGVDRNPPDAGYLCMDSPQATLVMNNQLISPATVGLYPRWTILNAAPDLRGG